MSAEHKTALSKAASSSHLGQLSEPPTGIHIKNNAVEEFEELSMSDDEDLFTSLDPSKYLSTQKPAPKAKGKGKKRPLDMVPEAAETVEGNESGSDSNEDDDAASDE